MSHFNPAFQNQIIASLPTADYQRLEPHLEFVSLSLGQVLYEPREPITHIYFPLKALVSLIRPVNHSSSKFGLVGNEGLVGFPALLGGESTISRAVVQLADGALKIDAKILKSEFDRGGMLQKQILLYLQLFITQTAQNAACRVHHSIEARLARWFLSIQDQLQQDKLRLTQRHIAELLGTRRATISEAAGQLQKRGIIRYTRGEITILSRSGLEEAACSCYGLLHHEKERLRAISQTIR